MYTMQANSHVTDANGRIVRPRGFYILWDRITRAYYIGSGSDDIDNRHRFNPEHALCIGGCDYIDKPGIRAQYAAIPVPDDD